MYAFAIDNYLLMNGNARFKYSFNLHLYTHGCKRSYYHKFGRKSLHYLLKQNFDIYTFMHESNQVYMCFLKYLLYFF